MSAVSLTEEPAPLSQRQILVVFTGLMLVLLLAALDSTIVGTALPTIVGEMGGITGLAWVATAYLLAQTVVTPLYGKLGDLYGRKGVVQFAVVLFLIGSALCGMSRSMTQLIIFRAIQGLGGGGLMVTTQAVVGDIVPPRDRGRYQGMFGAVFGVAAVLGPLVGGWLTKNWSWRWIFYVNLPFGLLALVVLALTLPPGNKRIKHTIDYAGAVLFATALCALVLVSDLAGTTLAWNSPVVFGLLALAGGALLAFIQVEKRAVEPLIPLRLFADRSFCVAITVGAIVGFTLFGTVTYLPVFLQIVKGSTPTASGIQILPLMGGILTTSIISGQVVSRTGRYKMFPVLGTAIMTIALFLLSQMTQATSVGTASLIFLFLGFGLGMVIQVLVVATQNSVPYRDLGVATSGTILFRLMGGSLGTAVLGTIFADRLHTNLERVLPAGMSAEQFSTNLTPEMFQQLPEAARTAYAQAFSASFSTVFVVGAAVAVFGWLISCMLPQLPLRQKVQTTLSEEIAAPFESSDNTVTAGPQLGPESTS
ncbi:MDR family MFS transporter [Planctomicrobium sp. SH664]|uniref:MDR family MFS transporter n=1 Tax=Planctomicrobium sp. SH664 TaxID=3448125 RepID=UPI003F5C77AE